MTIFENPRFCIFLFLLWPFSFTFAADYTINNGTLKKINDVNLSKPKYSSWKDVSNNQDNVRHYFANISGGYGNFNGVLNNDGQTGIIRFALGPQFNFSEVVLLGAELGIQTGNRMRIHSENAIIAIGSAPVFLTEKPIVDALLSAAYHIGATPLSLRVKGGFAYRQGMLDSATIPNKSKINPEAQLGLKYELSQATYIIGFYQYIMGNKPILTNINIEHGTATLNQLPTLQAVFIGIERSF